MALQQSRRRPNGAGANPVRPFRVPRSAWRLAQARARTEGVTISNAIVTLLDGYGQGLVSAAEVTTTWPSAATFVTSLRVSDEVWARAEQVAARDGLTMGAVLVALAVGYSNGDLDLPKVNVVW